MSKQQLITSIESDDFNLFSKQYLSLPDLCDEIEERLANKPDGRKKKLLADWKEKTNFLIDMYNAKAKFKTYNRVK